MSLEARGVSCSRRWIELSWAIPTHHAWGLRSRGAFAEWHTTFPSATCATALVVHRADIVKIEGESYRLRESEVDATTRSKSRRDKKPATET